MWQVFLFQKGGSPLFNYDLLLTMPMAQNYYLQIWTSGLCFAFGRVFGAEVQRWTRTAAIKRRKMQ
jgi:hypothetical protein